MDNAVWTQKGATFSHNNAIKEFGISKEEIFKAIDDGKLQYKRNYAHGNPYFKLLRHEVEAYVIETYGDDYLEKRKLDKELKAVKRDLNKYKRQIKILEKRKAELEEYFSK